MAKGKWFNGTAEKMVEKIFKQQGGHVWFVTFKNDFLPRERRGKPTKMWFIGNKIPKEYKDKQFVVFELVK